MPERLTKEDVGERFRVLAHPSPVLKNSKVFTFVVWVKGLSPMLKVMSTTGDVAVSKEVSEQGSMTRMEKVVVAIGISGIKALNENWYSPWSARARPARDSPNLMIPGISVNVPGPA